MVVSQDRVAILDEVYAYGRDQGGMWNISPDAGKFIHLMLRAIIAKRVLEIGTSNGYSTLWIADALESTGGWLTTLEIDARKVAMATENLERAELKERVRIIHGDARESIQTLDKRYDFVFIDADKESYEHYLQESLKRVRPGAIIMADNVQSHESELGGFLEMVQRDPWLEDVYLPFAGGLATIYVGPGR
jgi:predicted O-methyltransferase YrrM